MVLTTIQRIFKAGLVSFWRNGWLSSAAVAVMALSLFVITALLLSNVAADSLLGQLENKVDISVYFKQEVAENDILKVKSELETLGEVREVGYVSAETALEQFKTRHKENSVLLQSLEELGSNPLEASVTIKAAQASQYEAISLFLENGRYKHLIDKVNFRQNQTMIDKLTAIIGASRRAGIAASLALIAIAVLVTFNTIRLAIFTSREEISVMRLVGASNWHIRGPFIIEGVLYGAGGSLLALLILLPITNAISPFLFNFTQSIDIWQYVKDNFWAIAALQTVIGVFLGITSSSIAIRRYLKA